MTFESARIKLTAFYLLIIMIVTLMFSFVVWRILTTEIERGLRVQVLRTLPRPELNRLQFNLPQTHALLLAEIKTRIAWGLFITDAVILVFSASAGYFLAGRTLRPIEQMLNEQKQFVADASHELRTPLTAIKTETEVALRDKKMTLDQSRLLLKSNLEEVDKLKSLTDFFLSLSRYQDSTIKPDFTKVGLKEIMDKVIVKLRPLGKKKNIKIIDKVGKIFLTGDPVSLNQLFTILLDNAIKYSNKNGKVEISAVSGNNHVNVKIADNGMGIKPKDLPHIFDRFYRADSSRSKLNVDGYGLGLSIAKSIVSQYHGKIEARSEFGKGTTIKVSFPS